MTEPVYLESGQKLVFACSVRWPGWCRSGRGEEDALGALAAYARRYAPVAARAGASRFPRSPSFEVVERVAGSGSTDFGVPGCVPEADRQPLTSAAASRLGRLVEAAWVELGEVSAASPDALRKGPRGGGRDRDAMVAHVEEAEVAYARKFGARVTPAEFRQHGPGLVRERIGAALTASRRPPPAGDKSWPAPYAARRVAWHALDHAWEMEDRSS